MQCLHNNKIPTKPFLSLSLEFNDFNQKDGDYGKTACYHPHLEPADMQVPAFN